MDTSTLKISDLTDREKGLVELILLMIPEMVESLIVQKVSAKKTGIKFFEDNKEFSGHLNFVQEIVEKTMLENPGLSDEKIYELATPEIKKKLINLSNLNLKTVKKPTDLVFKGDHGAL